MKETVNESSGEVQMVIFDLASEQYGVDISDVREIMRMQNITRVPGVSSFVEGVINLRGKVLPVVDLRKRLGLPLSEHTKDSRIVVIDIASGEIGVIVDAVLEVLRVQKSTIDPASPLMVNSNYDYLKGIAKLPGRLVILIDSFKALSRANEYVDHEAMVEALKSSATSKKLSKKGGSKEKEENLEAVSASV